MAKGNKITPEQADAWVEKLRQSPLCESLTVNGGDRVIADMTARALAKEHQDAKPAPKKRKRKATALPSGWSVTLTVPVKVVSEMNRRDHWATRKRRFDAQAAAVWQAWLDSPLDDGYERFGIDLIGERGSVTMTHIGKRMDDDNLAGAFKAVRDQIANLIGIDDGDDRVAWRYEQRPGKGGIEIRLESQP